MKLSMKNISLAVIIAGLLSFASYSTAEAVYSGTVFGASDFQGYFEGENLSLNGNLADNVLPRIYANCYDGQPTCAIPKYIETVGNTSDPNTLIGLLYSAYTNVSPVSNNYTATQRKYGAAFIVNTLLGRNMQPSNGITISAADWSALESKLDASTITWGVAGLSNNDGTDCINSLYYAYGPNGPDNYFYSEPPGSCHASNRTGIRITDAAGGVYKIWNLCANPVGRSPVPNWEVTLATNVDRTTASAGEVIDWLYDANIAGSMATDRSVSYGWYNTRANGSNNNAFNNKLTNDGTFVNGTTPGSFVWYHQFYTVQASNIDTIGSQICSQATALPGSRTNNSRIYDTPKKCVTIIAPQVSPSDCRTIQVPVKLKTYPSVDKSHGGYSAPHIPAITMPVNVYVDGSLVASNVNADQVLNDPSSITSHYTDGNSHVVTFQEVSSHVSSYTDNDHTESSSDGGDPPSITYWTVHDGFTPNYTAAASWTDSFQCYDYSLSSNGVTSSNSIVEAGSLVQLSPQISSASMTSGGASAVASMNLHTKSKNSNWQITQLVIAPGVGGLSSVAGSSVAGSSADNPCSYYQSSIGAASSCAAANAITNASAAASTPPLTGSTVFNTGGGVFSGANPFDRYSAGGNYSVIGDYAPGTRICYAFSVYAASSEPKSGAYDVSSSSVNPARVNTDGGSWRHSPISLGSNCIKVVKKPKVQVLGSDLITGRAVSGYSGGAAAISKVSTTTSVKKLNGVDGVRLFGSWAEYAIAPLGAVTGMSSASAFNGLIGMQLSNSVSANSLTSGAICNFSKLSFVNSSGGGCFGNNIGNYSNSNNIPDVESNFTVTNATTSFGGGDLTAAQGLYKTNGDITINGGNIGAGQWVVINAGPHRVTIAGNIHYSNGNITALSQIPQVIIIANQINIMGSVTNIDSWLVAKGINGQASINTCIESGNVGALTSNMCTQPLLVNGPVMAKHLYLRRTAGSGFQTSSGDPAETFNLRADAYLWAFSHTSQQTPIQTTYTTELPPRL
jgi:hypothetical protein